MNIKNMGIFILFFCLIGISIGTVSAVTVQGDDFDDIQSAIDSSNPVDTIDLGNNKYTASNITNPISVTGGKNLTISGQSNTNRATLDAKNFHSILYVDSRSSVTIRYVNFVNGGTDFLSGGSSIGGAILSHGSLIIENCTFTDSIADVGSAIYITGGSNTIISYCSFNNNNAHNEGGAIYHRGFGVLTISNSIFNGNHAKNGGAIYTSGPALITSSNFVNNVATSNGGAIYTTNSLNITGGTINGNNASYGSGIYNVGTLWLNNVVLINNNAQILSINLLEAPNSLNEGVRLVVKASLSSGDNIANAIYTKNNNVYIDNNRARVSDNPANKLITLDIDGKIYTLRTDSNGIATFNVSAFTTPSSKILSLSVSHTDAGKAFNKSKNVQFIAKNNVVSISPSVSTTVNKVNVKANVKKKPTTNKAVTKIKTLSNTKAKAFVKKQKSSSSKSTNTVKQAYDYRNKKMVWFNVANSATIDMYPAGLRLTTVATTSNIKYAIVSGSTKTKSSYNSKTKITTTTSYKILYNIKGSKSKVVMITTSSSKQNSSNVANPYLSTSTNTEVNNPRIVALAKQITNSAKSDDYYTKAKLIYQWVQKNIDYDLNANMSAVSILSQKGSNGNYKAYCVGFSNVMAALCRSVGVPVQYHAIFFFEANQYPFQAHEGHVYSKVYVNGQWLFADAATVGFIAPLNYKSYLQTMPTQPGGSYYTTDNKWNYWDFVCNHNLASHSDPTIIREAQGVPVQEYFILPSKALITTASAAYNVLNPYASNNGYTIYKNQYFTGSSNEINPNVYIPIWGFHFFDSHTGAFMGYMLLSQTGVLYPAWETSYRITSGTAGVNINYW